MNIPDEDPLSKDRNASCDAFNLLFSLHIRLHGGFDFAANSKLSKEFQQNRRNYVTIEV